MLVPSYFQISPKSRYEIQAPLIKAGRQIKIDPDDRRESLGNNDREVPVLKKRKNNASSYSGKGYAEVHEVYNKKAEIVTVFPE